MKFKSIFIVFNIVIVLSFLFFFLMPVFIIGMDHFLDFFSVFTNYWIFIALGLFLILLIVFNTYFILNWRFFRLLEKEDWYGLVGYLENKIYNNKMFSKRSIRILLNTYLCTSNTEGIKKLALFLKKHKPDYISYFSLQFSIPYLIAGTPEESELFFKQLLEDTKLKHRDWIIWNHGIILMQQKKKDEAVNVFSLLLLPDVDNLVSLLALFMLNSLCYDNKQLKNKIDTLKSEYRRSNTMKELIEKIDRNKSNIQVLSLRSTITDALHWMYPEQGEIDVVKGEITQEN